jgi:hypothetical protein
MRDEYFEYMNNIEKDKSEKSEFIRKQIYSSYLRNKKVNLYSVMLAVTGIIVLLTKDLILNFIDKQYSIVFIILGASAFALGVGSLLYKYLQVGPISRLGNSNFSEHKLISEFQDLKIEFLKLRKKNGEPNDSENISKTINNVIDKTLTDDFIKAKVEGIYSEKAVSESKHKTLLNDFDSLGYRINEELARLRRSANLNLVIGTLTTTLALTGLGYEVFNSELEITDSLKILAHYLPRLSLIIFIEIFAFFFLKLYKTTLEDIKYFNNEKTNIDFKLISLKSALTSENKDLIKLVIEELVKTERNFKLKKGESTVELEKIKNHNETSEILSKLITKLKDKI